MNKKGDFHTHSTASDGLLSPAELVKYVNSYGFDYVSITDHDTVSGIDEALETGKKLGINVIPGIELSTIHNGESVHILGYFKDDSYKSITLIKFLKELKQHRVQRAKKIIENLKLHFNIEVNYELVEKYSNNIIARPHIARAIIGSGYDYSFDYIFNNFLGNDSPAYVPNMELSIQEGIALLKKHNALTVLAHPVLIKKTPFINFSNFEFDGIEALYYLNTHAQTKNFIKYAENNNLLISAGSDFHGNAADKKHGQIGSVYLSDKRLDLLITKLS